MESKLSVAAVLERLKVVCIRQDGQVKRVLFSIEVIGINGQDLPQA